MGKALGSSPSFSTPDKNIFVYLFVCGFLPEIRSLVLHNVLELTIEPSLT